MEGIRDHEHLGLNQSYFRVRLSPCSESRLRSDQIARGVQCKGIEEINEWRYDKGFVVGSLTPFANYMRNQDSYMKQEEFFTTIKMKDGLFTDSGYRFRYNVYNKTSNNYF